MSAITGIYQMNSGSNILVHGLNLMKALNNSPADDIQIWQQDHIFLGCHAQWITPESVGEQIPYYDRERKLAVTADAIIDNREELFDLLQIKHTDQKEMPDSQIILLAYRKWGQESPKYLVGDFAFMIWDEKEGLLFGARDFSGSRTLYYYHNQNCFTFSTTIQPLLTLPFVKKEINDQWMAEYLAIVGMVDVVDTSITAYKHIMQLPPSHSITINRETIKLKKYCQLTSPSKLRLKTDDEYVEAFQTVYKKAIASKLRTYKGVGAQLSGGLDSGSIVSFAVEDLRKSNKTLRTFSYVPPSEFEDFTPRNVLANETPLIKSTVEYIGEGIQDHYYDFKGSDPYIEMDSFLQVMESPYKFFENSYWLKGMFEKAREHQIGILLNGGRGNLSISWGSAIDFYATLFKKLKWQRLIKELNQYSKNTGGSRYRNLPFIIKEAYPIINKILPEASPFKFPMLINTEFAKQTKVFEKLQEFGFDRSGWFATNNIYEQRKRHFEDLFHWNASNTIASKLSIKNAVWKRDPTNDLRVIQFCLSLPEEQYVQNGLDRALIRRATINYLPDQVRLNQSIRGVQGADWVWRMKPQWNTFLEELQHLSSDHKIFHYINKQVIIKAISKAQSGAKPVYATDPDLKILMRSLIVYRFLKNFERG